MVRAVERAAEGALRQKHPDRPLRANVEFYTAPTLFSLGIPSDEFTCMFACGRMAGWTSHIIEQLANNRLIRPQATYASKVELSGGKATVTREVDAGLETIEVDLPAVITVDLRLNEPRYVKLPDIMKAKKKPLDVTSLDALGVSAAVLLKTVKTDPPAQRQKGVLVKDVAELVDILKKKGLI